MPYGTHPFYLNSREPWIILRKYSFVIRLVDTGLQFYRSHMFYTTNQYNWGAKNFIIVGSQNVFHIRRLVHEVLKEKWSYNS